MVIDKIKQFANTYLFKKQVKSYAHKLDRDLNVVPTYNGRVLDYENDYERICDAFSNWFFSTTDEIARVVCQAEYEFIQYSSDGEEKIIPDNAIWYDLVDFPNPQMGRMELWYLTWSSVRTFGNAFWYCPKNLYGKPAEFYFLHKEYGRVYVKKDTKGNVIGYELDKGFGQVEKFLPEEIIHFKYPSILSATYGKSPSMHFSEMIDLDKRIKENANTHIERGLNVSSIVNIKGNVSDADYKVVQKQLSELTGANARRTYILAKNSEIDVKNLSQSLKDIDYLQALEKTRKQIYAANGVPIVDESINRSVAEVGQYVFMLKTIMPDLRMFADFLNRNIFWKYDKNIWIRFKNLIPEDRKLEADIHQIYKQISVLTPDEIRDEINMPPHNGGIGSEPMSDRNSATLKDVVNKQLQNFFAEGRAIPQNKQDDTVRSELEKILETRGNGHDG